MLRLVGIKLTGAMSDERSLRQFNGVIQTWKFDWKSSVPDSCSSSSGGGRANLFLLTPRPPGDRYGRLWRSENNDVGRRSSIVIREGPARDQRNCIVPIGSSGSRNVNRNDGRRKDVIHSFLFRLFEVSRTKWFRDGPGQKPCGFTATTRPRNHLFWRRILRARETLPDDGVRERTEQTDYEQTGSAATDPKAPWRQQGAASACFQSLALPLPSTRSAGTLPPL